MRSEAGYHFVLVHGLGHGAWCWYKVTALLEAAGHTVTALDLASGGIDKTVADTVTSVADYLAPLTTFLANSVVDHQVILVGHSLGGSSISYAMEAFPEKVDKAIFLSAFMPLSGDIFLDYESLKGGLASGLFHFVNDQQRQSASSDATSIHVTLTKVSDFFYNKCSKEDVSLSKACLSPTPYVLTKHVLHLTNERYGSVPRFYISCLEDNAIPPSNQKYITAHNPPLKEFTMQTSDHSSFFCEPHALVDILLIIARS